MGFTANDSHRGDQLLSLQRLTYATVSQKDYLEHARKETLHDLDIRTGWFCTHTDVVQHLGFAAIFITLPPNSKTTILNEKFLQV